jgi:hypothetical protein
MWLLSRVTIEEQAIIRAQQLDLIYSQSQVLYEIFPMHHGMENILPNQIMDHTLMV